MIKLHLGSGNIILDGWINIDAIEGAGIRTWDLSRGLPTEIEDSSVDFIYTQHFLEHLSRDQAVTLLSACSRAMKQGGVIRVVVPDLDELVRRYVENEVYNDPGGYQPRNRCEMMNDAFRMWGHQFMYNFTELFSLLQEAGFRQTFCPAYRISSYPELCELDSRSPTDLIMEGIKT